VHAERDVPAAWRGAPVHRIGRATVLDRDALTAAVEALRRDRLARRARVVALDASLPWARILAPERERRPLWSLGADHRLLHDELAFLLRADLVDARSGSPVWWPAVRARRLGCRVAPAAHGADVLLPDGRPAWIDGGPRGPVHGWPEDDGDGALRIHRESIELAGRLDADRDAVPDERLSAEQLAAVRHAIGPARVLAPAGSGKTRVLAARLRHLVHDRGIQPELITALAYNTRAAAELAQRTRDVHVDGRRPQVRTVHALGLAVCSAALGRRPVVLDAAGVAALLREASDGRVGTAGGPAVDAVLAALTDVRLALRDPIDVERSRGDVPGFAALVPRYRRLLHARGALDFDEQVHLAVTLLLADPVLRARTARSTTHLLVDEAQDLTPVFVLLVRLLAGPAQQLFAVGDDDQTIYGYAGATPRVLVDLPDRYGGAASYTLRVNHRCPPAVVRAATDLLAHNIVRVDKDVHAAQDATSGRGLEVLDAPAPSSAPRTVARLVGLLDAHRPGDIAVLARVSASLLAPQVALAEAGVPVLHHVGSEMLGRTGLRTVLAYLRIATDPDRITAADLTDTMHRPARRLTGALPPGSLPTGTTSLARLARRVTSVDAEHRPALRRYVEDLAGLTALVRSGADSATVLASLRDGIGLGAALDALDRGRQRPEGSSHGDDLVALEELAALSPDPSALPGWLADRLARASRGRAETGAHHADGADAVTLSTVHRVKGREWDVVVIVGLRAGLFPHRLCDDVEEERRVLHVALTRARQHLLLVSDPDRPSPFLPELTGTIRPRHAAARDEQELLEALRTWRRQRASRDRVPPFLVAHDRTLGDLARRRPSDRIALRACHGIGPAKVLRYGDELLALLAHPMPTLPAMAVTGVAGGG
jgi:DNA helicase II / ATP-dependent DNA helicase PcrA